MTLLTEICIPITKEQIITSDELVLQAISEKKKPPEMGII
jgi:hypothetical protein